MKKHLFVALFLLLGFQLSAITPDPYTVSVGFSFVTTGAPNPTGTGLF